MDDSTELFKIYKLFYQIYHMWNQMIMLVLLLCEIYHCFKDYPPGEKSDLAGQKKRERKNRNARVQ